MNLYFLHALQVKGEMIMSAVIEVASDTEKEYEIVDGHPEEKIMGGARHGGVGVRLLIRIGAYIESHNLGGLYGPETTFLIGENERIPDIAFVSIERIPTEGEPEGIWQIAPDLAVEVISPNDIYEKVQSKVREYLQAGVRQVWIVSPEHQTVTIFRSPTKVEIFSGNDDLLSEDVLPGFRCHLGEIFKTPARV